MKSLNPYSSQLIKLSVKKQFQFYSASNAGTVLGSGESFSFQCSNFGFMQFTTQHHIKYIIFNILAMLYTLLILLFCRPSFVSSPSLDSIPDLYTGHIQLITDSSLAYNRNSVFAAIGVPQSSSLPLQYDHAITFHGLQTFPATGLAFKTNSILEGSQLKIQLQLFKDTVLDSLWIGYIVMSPQPNIIQLISGSVTQGSISNGVGHRFDQLQFSTNFPSNIGSVFLECFSLENWEDLKYSLQAQWRQLNSSKVQVDIIVAGHSLATQVQFSLIFFNAENNNKKSEFAYSLSLDINNASFSQELKNDTISNGYVKANMVLYGFGSFQIYAFSARAIQLKINETNVEGQFDKKAQAMVNFFIVGDRKCNSNQHFYPNYTSDQKQILCVSDCPDDLPKISNNNFCEICNQSCKKCFNESYSCSECQDNRTPQWRYNAIKIQTVLQLINITINKTISQPRLIQDLNSTQICIISNLTNCTNITDCPDISNCSNISNCSIDNNTNATAECTQNITNIIDVPIYDCPCTSGYTEVDQTCVKCDSILLGCLECSNSSFCTNCSQGFINENGNCACTPPSFLVTNSCIQEPGCIGAFNQPPLCTACDSLRQFSLNSSDECQCLPGTYLPENPNDLQNSQCVLQKKCGDGYRQEREECDDGNNISNDGCSNCKKDPFFVCEEIQRHSYCRNITNFTLYFREAIRYIDSNSGYMLVELSPYSFNLKNVNWYQNLVSNFDFTITSVNYIEPAKLRFEFQFNHTIENNQYQFKYMLQNIQYFKYETLPLKFTLTAFNAQLTYEENPQQNIIWINLYFSLIIILAFVALLSLFVERWFGLQTIMVFQTVFFTFSIMQSIPFQLAPALWELRYSTGFTIFYDYQPFDLWPMPRNFKAFYFFKTFKKNFTIINFSIILFFLVLSLVIKVIRLYFSKKIQQGQDYQMQLSGLNSIMQFILNRIFLVLSLSSVFLVIFSLYLQVWKVQQVSAYHIQSNIIMISLSLLIVLCIVSYIIFRFLLDISKNENSIVPMTIKFIYVNQFYPVFFILYNICFINLLACLSPYQTSVYVILSLQAIYLLVLIYLLPYNSSKSCLHNGGIIINQLVCIYGSIICLYWNNIVQNRLEDTNIDLMLIGLYILLLLVIIITIIRIIVRNQYEGEKGIISRIIRKIKLLYRQFNGEAMDKMQKQDQRQMKLQQKKHLEEHKKMQPHLNQSNFSQQQPSQKQALVDIPQAMQTQKKKSSLVQEIYTKNTTHSQDFRGIEDKRLGWIPQSSRKIIAPLKINNHRQYQSKFQEHPVMPTIREEPSETIN